MHFSPRLVIGAKVKMAAIITVQVGRATKQTLPTNNPRV
jgi:hypothetical protein